MKKVLIGLLVLLLAGGGFFYWYRTSKSNKRKGESTRTVTVATGKIERAVESTGEVTPLNRVEIKPPISGRMEELLVDEGSIVKKGQTLAWMSSSDRAAILDAARAGGAR